MFGFIDRQRQKAKEQLTSGYELYRTLMHRAAEKGDLSATDEEKLAKVAGSLGFTLERIEADAAALKEAADLDAVYAGRDAHRKAMAAANDAAEAYRKETDRIEAEHAAVMRARAERQPQLNWAATEANDSHEAAVKAGNEARVLRHKHARLFGTDTTTPPEVETWWGYSNQYERKPMYPADAAKAGLAVAAVPESEV